MSPEVPRRRPRQEAPPPTTTSRILATLRQGPDEARLLAQIEETAGDSALHRLLATPHQPPQHPPRLRTRLLVKAATRGRLVSIVGVDLSLASTGVALVDSSNVATWRIQSKGTKTDTLAERAQRVITISNTVMRHIPTDVQLVIIEGRSSLGQARQAGEHLRAGLWRHLATSVYLQGHPVVEVPPATLKLNSTGKGNAAKDQVLAAIIKRHRRCGFDRQRHRRRPGLAATGARRLGFPIEESLPVAHLAAMTKINWPGVSWMAEPGNFKFLERWQNQVRKDPQVIKDLLAIALLISTEARGNRTQALMSQQQLAEDLGCPNQQPNGASRSCKKSDIWRW